jgi:ketosteroid isomerase-like protein
MRTAVTSTNTDVVERLLDHLSVHDIAAATALFTRDAELVAPFAPPPLPPGGSGREQIGTLFVAIFDAYGRVAFTHRRIVATADPDVVVGRWRTHIEVLASGATYAAEVIAVIELRDGRIARFTEYFNPDALRAAGVLPIAA